MLDLVLLEKFQLDENFAEFPAALDEVRSVFELLLLDPTLPNENLTETILNTAGTGPYDEAGSEIESPTRILTLTHQYPGSLGEIQIPERLGHLLVHFKKPPSTRSLLLVYQTWKK
jgi:hypothetical protein